MFQGSSAVHLGVVGVLFVVVVGGVFVFKSLIGIAGRSNGSVFILGVTSTESARLVIGECPLRAKTHCNVLASFSHLSALVPSVHFLQ